VAIETVTLELDEPIYRAARRVADMTGQPLDDVLRTSIAHALPPLDDVPADEAADLAALVLLDDGGLWRAARSELEVEQQAELQELLSRQGNGDLDPPCDARLHELLDAYGRLTVRKAHAYLLLARRGYRVPMQVVAGSSR
jgi:hypothetical protein